MKDYYAFNNMKIKNERARGLFNHINKHFSTLIVPEILNGKIHQSILNLTTAASQLDKDVKIKIILT